MKAQFVDLNNSEQLDEVFEVSKTKPIILFKHSTTCPISANIFEEVSNVDSTIFLVVVQDSRELAKAIAEKTGIKHESPQAIVVKDGKSIYHASHYDITAEDLTYYLAENGAS
jgi:bacillithiol system protein YtxJ